MSSLSAFPEKVVATNNGIPADAVHVGFIGFADLPCSGIETFRLEALEISRIRSS